MEAFLVFREAERWIKAEFDRGEEEARRAWDAAATAALDEYVSSIRDIDEGRLDPRISEMKETEL